jgi:hypothetical protein
MKAKLKGRTLYFDEEASALIKRLAKASHKTPKQIVIAALKRGMRRDKHVEK